MVLDRNRGGGAGTAAAGGQIIEGGGSLAGEPLIVQIQIVVAGIIVQVHHIAIGIGTGIPTGIGNA